MTIHELSQYQYVHQNIEKINERITELEATQLSASKMQDIKVSNSNVDNPTERISMSIIELKTKLIEQLEQLYDFELRINNFISTIEDEEIKYIVREKYLNLKTWYDIAADLDCDRTTPRKKLKKYLKERKDVKC